MMLKILFVSAFGFLIFNYILLVNLIITWLIYYTVIYSCILIVSLPFLKKILLNLRHYNGIRATTKENLDKEFLEHNGIVGYKPVKERHVAIIFVSDLSNDYSNISYKEISPLIEDYDSRKVNYKLYFCYLTDDLLNIVKSKYVYGIHIFGHGAIDSLSFEDGVLQYRELKNVEPKEFVAQWHCNHGRGKSLGELIGKKYFVPYGYTIIKGNKRKLTKLIDGKIKWSVNQNLK